MKNFLPNSLKIVFTDVSFKYLSVGLTIIGGVLLLPFYLQYITKEQYGIWLATGNSINMFSIVGGGFDIVILQRLSKAFASKREERIKYEFSAGLLLTLAFALLIGLFGFLLKPYAITWLNIPVDEMRHTCWIIDICLIALILNLLFFQIKTIPLAKLNPKIAGLVEVGAKATSLIVTVLCIVSGMGILSFAFGQLSLSLIGLIVLLIIERKSIANYFTIEVPKIYFIVQFREYYPSFLGRSGNVVFANLQVPLVSGIMDPSVAASYGVTKRIFDSLRMLFMPFTKTIIPVLTARINDRRLGELEYGKLIKKYGLFIGSLAGVICTAFITAPFVINIWVGNEYYIGDLIAGILALLLFVEVAKQLLGSVLTSYDYRYEVSWIGTGETAMVSIFYIFIYYTSSSITIVYIPTILLLSALIATIIQTVFSYKKNLFEIKRMGYLQLIIILLLGFLLLINYMI